MRHETNKGYYINEVSSQEIVEIYDTRILIEISLVPDIMCNLNGRELKRLEKTLEEFKQAVAEEDYYKKTFRNFKKQLQIICKMLKSTYLKVLRGCSSAKENQLPT